MHGRQAREREKKVNPENTENTAERMVLVVRVVRNAATEAMFGFELTKCVLLLCCDAAEVSVFVWCVREIEKKIVFQPSGLW